MIDMPHDPSHFTLIATFGDNYYFTSKQTQKTLLRSWQYSTFIAHIRQHLRNWKPSSGAVLSRDPVSRSSVKGSSGAYAVQEDDGGKNRGPSHGGQVAESEEAPTAVVLGTANKMDYATTILSPTASTRLRKLALPVAPAKFVSVFKSHFETSIPLSTITDLLNEVFPTPLLPANSTKTFDRCHF